MSDDAHAAHDYTIAADGTFHAPLVLSYPYKRTMGPTMSRFLIGLRDRRIEATIGTDGTVYVPPAEFDPSTGATLTDWRTVADTGAVTTWSWQPVASESAPLPHPFAWALIKLDGADTPLLHVVDAGAPSAIATGDRVKARWSEEPQASMHGIVAFDLIAPITDSAAPAPPTGPRGARP